MTIPWRVSLTPSGEDPRGRGWTLSTVLRCGPPTRPTARFRFAAEGSSVTEQRPPGPLAGTTLQARLRRAIRDIPDFPKPGIVFKDITPLLRDATLFAAATDAMADHFNEARVTHVVAIESRGFLLGGPVARRLGAGLVPMRKVGKLPYRTYSEEYALEYGTDRLEMHVDALEPDARVLIVDDVLATGGTAAAACRLAERFGGAVVGCTFLIALSFLGGLDALRPRRVAALITY
jgi:adenine phosphoribosyltransferase